MQLVQTTRDALLKPLSTVAGIVERRHTLPILANILMRKEGNKVAFIATDLEVQITTHADFGVGQDNESTTVAARKLLDILKALPDTGEVAGAGQQQAFRAVGQEPLRVADAGRQRVPHRGPARAVGRVADAAAAHAAPPVQHGALRHGAAGHPLLPERHAAGVRTGPRAVATDGHRLAHCSTEADGIKERHEVIVPRKTVLEMQRLLEDSDEPVSIDVAPGQIRFRFGDVELVSKLVEGKFPDFTRVIPTNYSRHFLVGREALQGSLQRAAILTTDKFRACACSWRRTR